MYKYSGCCINDKNQTMLVSSYTSDDQALYEVSLADGSTTKLYDYPESLQVRNMYIFTGVADKAPAAPQLSVTAPEGSMSPHYVVTLPDVLNDGTPASGLFHWCLRANGNVIAEGNNRPGTVIDGDYTFETPGKVTFSVAADNEGGKSATAKVTIFVGNGIPTDPASVKAAWADGKMSLSWDAVTASADGGYIDPAQVTYTVTDSLGMTVEGITTNAYEFDLAVPEVRTNYKYYVIASFCS